MISLFLLATVAAARQSALPSTPVSFSCRAEQLSQLLPQLGAAAGVKLEPAPACAGDVMIVSAANVPLGALMSRIARVDAAQWVSTSDGYRLSPSSMSRNAEARTETRRRVAAIRAALDDLKKKQAAPLPADGTQTSTATVSVGVSGSGGAAATFAGAQNTPEARAVTALLVDVDPEEIAISPGDRVVFSTAPNGTQKPLGSGAQQILDQLVEEHNKAIEAKNSKKPNNDADLATMPQFVRDIVSRTSKPVSGYTKADLSIAQTPYVATLQATLVLYDSAGTAVLAAPETLDPGVIDQLLLATQKPKPVTTDTPVALSDDTKAFNSVFANSRTSGGRNGLVIPQSVRPYLEDPDHHDPLALAPSDDLLALAKARKLPLVALIPDEVVSLLGSALGGTATVEGFERDLAANKTMAQLPDPNWLLVEPAFPVFSRDNRTDRGALGALMREARDKGVPSLDDIAAFSLHAPSPLIAGVSQLYVAAFASGALGQGLNAIASWDLFRIYAQLTTDQRQSLESGGHIPISLLTPGEQASLRQMVYGAIPQLHVTRSNDPGSDAMTQMVTAATGGSDYRDEPTEVLPSGVPGNGYLEMTIGAEPLLSPVPASPSPDNMPVTMGVDEIAALKYLASMPAMAQYKSMIPQYDKFRVGSRTVYTLTFHLTKTAQVTGTLKDSHLPSDAPTYASDNLPPDVQAAIDKKMEDLKKSPLGALAALGGSSAPHP